MRKEDVEDIDVQPPAVCVLLRSSSRSRLRMMENLHRDRRGYHSLSDRNLSRQEVDK